MDNLTHTLVGVALADAGLKRTTRFGTLALAVGANLPDVDVLVYAVGSATDALALRRGWTHGVLAMAVLPLLLAGALWLLDRARPARQAPTAGSAPPLRVPLLLLLSAIGVLSHPLLDLLNTYGVRLLMPFSDRWFYGDTLFIIDPWVWAALIAGVALSRRSAATSRPARVALAACGAYVALMAASSVAGRRVVETQAAAGPALRTLVSPTFGNPLHRRVVRDLGDAYEAGELRWGLRPAYAVEAKAANGRNTAAARAAAATHDGAAFLSWSRYPHVTRIAGRDDADTVEVLITDARYAPLGAQSWASVAVRVPATAVGR